MTPEEKKRAELAQSKRFNKTEAGRAHSSVKSNDTPEEGETAGGFIGFIVFKCGRVAKAVAEKAKDAAKDVVHTCGVVHKELADRAHAFSEKAKIAVVSYGQTLSSVLNVFKRGLDAVIQTSLAEGIGR